MYADSPTGVAVLVSGLDVGDGLGVGARADGVLAVVDNVELDPESVAYGVNEGGDGPVAFAGDGHVVAADAQMCDDRGAIAGGGRLLGDQLHGSVLREVLPAEHPPHLGRGDLGAGVLGGVLNGAGKFDLEPAGQDHAVLGLHDVGDAALPGLRVDPDDRLVSAPDVVRVDGQVRDLPLLVVVAQRGDAFLDGVLVRSGEGGVDEVADVGVSRMHREPVAVFGDPPEGVDVADVELGVDAL